MGLAKFYSLLTNKSFCLVFIRTLEQQSKITKDEKKAIGCLLTITVQNEKNMLYLPEILEELLTDAVIKAGRTKKGTLKLKRKNSIVEFMLTAWIAITLYSHIKTYIGESLYDLFLVMTIRADMEPRKIFRGLAKERVNRVFEKILTFNDQPLTYFPAPIKYMCDMLDNVAEKCGINEEHVTRRWKCNSLHLGLWVKILQRPQLVFDINPSKDVKRGFRIIEQAFTEICSETTRSTSKATELYEEISTFKTQLQKYFDDVKALPSVSKGALKRYLEENLQDQSDSSERLISIDELVKFVVDFDYEITEALQRDENCKTEGHAATLNELVYRLAEHPYEQIPSKYQSLQPRPVVHYDSLHHFPPNPRQYQDLYLEYIAKYTRLQHDKEEIPSEAS